MNFAHKSIVIGCDDTNTLSAILRNIKQSPTFAHSVISVTRPTDLTGIALSMNADLAVLCFRNNQHALNDCCHHLNKSGTPILCLGRKTDGEKLRWPKGSIVFSYPIEPVQDDDYLTSRIQSILLLRTDTHINIKPIRQNTGSLAEAALHQKHTDHAGNMSRYVLELDQKIEVLAKIKERISDLYPQVDDSTRTELMSIVHSIKVSAHDHKLWDDFKVYFERTNPGFLMILANRHPELTPKDLKYCCYLKMNMSNDDIRNLLGINQESVRTHKYRLKKKMELPRKQDLISYLRSVEEE